MRSTRFWILLLKCVLLISIAAALFISHRSADNVTANIYKDGELLQSIDLSQVGEAYSVQISGEAVENTVLVENGRICVSSATCPDQVCVRQGWISTGIVPVVCLPNNLVIRIEGAPAGVDAATH